jgi:RNA-directed DNA polymerase
MMRQEIRQRVEHACAQLTQETTTSNNGYYYTTFSIPKRFEWVRIITSPSTELGLLQRDILSELLVQTPPHDAATAFYAGRSILNNAKQHHRCRFMLKSDIVDFFPSIKMADVLSVLSKNLSGFDMNYLRMLSVVLTCSGSLPQGAPTSPHLSNLYMQEFDELIDSACRAVGAVYTRYADDIAISADNEEGVMIVGNLVSLRLRQLGFLENPRKRKLYKPSDRKIITGLDVSGETIRPTKKFRKSTAAMLRVMIVHKRFGMARQIRGRLAFWQSISPDDHELANLSKQFAYGQRPL